MEITGTDKLAMRQELMLRICQKALNLNLMTFLLWLKIKSKKIQKEKPKKIPNKKAKQKKPKLEMKLRHLKGPFLR